MTTESIGYDVILGHDEARNFTRFSNAQLVRGGADDTYAQPAAERFQQALGEQAGHAFVADWLQAACSVSPYLAHTCHRYPQLLQQLLETGALQQDAAIPEPEQLQAQLSEVYAQARLSQPLDTSDTRERCQLMLLRQFRHQHMLRILLRSLSGVASLDETLLELSNSADACVVTAVRWAHETTALRFGEPHSQDGEPQQLIVLAMGKLGGYELNVSSDIDLICLYHQSGSTSGDSNGKRIIDNGDFFRRVTQQFSRLLSTPTEDGFVYRVDTRLRPFGESGPLVMNFDGLEHYYLTQGRDWERYAMIKARPITGSPDALQLLDELISPFVYRRYLDYSAIESLRELKRKIAVSLRQKRMQNNIKLGAGGIREIEFIAQAFQLVRGGRDHRLRLRPVKQVLAELSCQGLMQPGDVDALITAYDFMRRVENGVQMMRDEQVHSLPED